MSLKYSYLLSPLKIKNHVLKNRIIAPQALPHYLQGPETFPADTVITHVSNIARNGAAIVTFNSWWDTDQRKAGGAASHFPMFDFDDPSVESYISLLTDTIHFYDSLASVLLLPMEMPNFQPIGDPEVFFPFRFSSVETVADITREMMDDMIKLAVEKCLRFKSLGFDMVTLHMGYREFIHIGMSKFFSPLTNNRTDEYGGPVENRVRFPLEMCGAIREACGPDFLIEVWVAGEEEDEGGIKVSDTVAFAKLAEGLVDIIEVRGGNINPVHPTGFNSKKGAPATLHVAEAVKKSGAKVLVAPAGGYQDPELNEKIIAEGKADLIAIGRAFICDPEYGKKLYEGRREDIVPCQRCAKCHVPYPNGPWMVMCSGNPVLGLENRIDRMISTPASIASGSDVRKKVAVVGGGPAGMKAALVANERGHDVVLFEKQSELGGLLNCADYPEFKWPLKSFKEWLVRQVEKSKIDVRLETYVTPHMITEGGFDAVIVAIGADSVRPDIPGVEGANVWLPEEVYSSESHLGQRVAVVGGGEIGTETALYLAECGHDVLVLTRQQLLASGAVPIHYREMFEERWQKCERFSYATCARTVEISETGVRYLDARGNEHFAAADSVVVAGGRQAKNDEALAFYGTADYFRHIGDCHTPDSVRLCMRHALAAASAI